MTTKLEPARTANLLAEFERKINAEIKIEPSDWMPDAYRQHLIRQISQHAHSEVSECSRKPIGSLALLR